LEGITIVAILAVLIAYFFRGGHLIDQPQITLAGLTLDNVRLGLVLAFFSFVGFESATVLGHEARDPLRVIPRSVITTVLATGLFFVLSSYALVAAFQGVEPGFAKVDAPVSLLAATVGLGILGPVISAGVAASFFASALASINAAARVVFALSRHGILHGKAGDAHETHATPHVAVSVVAAVVLAFSLSLTVRGVGLLDAFGYFGSVATFGFLVSYVLVSIGAPVFLKRRGELKSRHIAIAIASVALLLLPLFGVLYPVPPYPQNLLPYVFAALLAAGTGYFLYVSRKLPDALKLIEADLGNVSGEPLAQRSA
jgi:amino acid transporter